MSDSDSKRRVKAVKERLQMYRQRDMDIDYQLERLERYKAKVMDYGVKPLSDMPHASSPTNDKFADYVAKKEELEENIRFILDIQDREKHHLEDILSEVRSAAEKAVIRMRYIDGCGWGEVVDVMFGAAEDYDEKQEAYLRRVHKIHGSALQSMVNVMEARESKEADTSAEE